MSKSEKIVIVGCGRLGGALANRLNAEGHQITVIDRREVAFDKLSVDFSGFKIIGDAVELHVLKQAGIETAGYVFATTTEDNANLMVAQVARLVFKVPHVVARVFDPAREAIYREFGVDTISPVQLSATAFMEILKS
jgi:trk system potassium uptake protein TrkA